MSIKLQNKNGIFYVTSPLLDSIGVRHAFVTRRGGVSCGDFSSMNVSTRRTDKNGKTDTYENTVENFRRAFSLIEVSAESSVCANQVHGKTILAANKSFCGMGILRGSERYEDCDGLFLSGDERSVGGICVKSADCTPVLFADKKLGSVCAVHSGWRGTCLDIVGEAVRVMKENGSNPCDIYCAVGPAIGVCCYEVSEEVYSLAKALLCEKNAKSLIDTLFINRRESEKGTKYDFNIGKMCAYLAELSGIPQGNIDFLDICTCCSFDSEGRIFFSHRGQNGYSGTFASVITNVKNKK